LRAELIAQEIPERPLRFGKSGNRQNYSEIHLITRGTKFAIERFEPRVFCPALIGITVRARMLPLPRPPMNIRFTSSLTPEDENAIAPAIVAAVSKLLDLLPIAYALRIETSDSHVYQHVGGTPEPQPMNKVVAINKTLTV